MTLTHVDDAVWGARARGIAQLERELARLRRMQGALAREHGLVVARASVLNLVVYATREMHARRAATTISELAHRHPSRAIIVLADRKEIREGIDAEISMHSHARQPDEAHQVSYEQILIRARGDSDQRIASAVIPLLLPDLPVFVWWTGTPPVDEAEFDDLVALADRLIVDSAEFARPDVTLRTVREVCVSGRGRYRVTDLNWTRLTPWRELVAQFFDVPDWRPFLDGVVGLRVGFAVDADGREIHPSQALLVVAWLAARLGWQAVEHIAPSEAGGLLFRMERGDGASIATRVRPRFEHGMSEGDVSGVRIQAASDGRNGEFVIKRTADARHAIASVSIDGSLIYERVVPLVTPSVEELLGEELTIVASDTVYEEALSALVALT